MSAVSIGSIIDDRYQVLECLGEGGMGGVYRCRELGLERIVAVKLLHQSLVGDKDDRLRFQREGKILSELSHPHIVTFYRFGLWKDVLPYLAMEYLAGMPLRKVLAESGTLPVDRAIPIFLQACDAINAAHAAGVVHRDLTPANIVLLSRDGGDMVKLVDFGLSRVVPKQGEMSQHLTQTGTLIGSVSYMSPEQCKGKKADTRSDIYSLGCVFYEVLTGEPPFDADSPIGLIHKHVFEPPKPITEVGQFPAGLDNVIARCLAKAPSQRYQSAIELADALRMVAEGRGQEIPGGAQNIGSKRLSPTKLAVVLFSIVFVVGMCVALGSLTMAKLRKPRDTFQVVRTKIPVTPALIWRIYSATAVSIEDRVNYYKSWLEKYGSSASKIEKVVAFWNLAGFLAPFDTVNGHHEELRLNDVREARDGTDISLLNLLFMLQGAKDGRFGNAGFANIGSAREYARHALDLIVRIMEEGDERSRRDAVFFIPRCSRILRNTATEESVLLRRAGRVPSCYLRLAQIEEPRGDYRSALNHLNALQQSDLDEKDLPMVMIERSICYQKLGQLKEAFACLKLPCQLAQGASPGTDFDNWGPDLLLQLCSLGKKKEALAVCTSLESIAVLSDSGHPEETIAVAWILGRESAEGCYVLIRYIANKRFPAEFKHEQEYLRVIADVVKATGVPLAVIDSYFSSLIAKAIRDKDAAGAEKLKEAQGALRLLLRDQKEPSRLSK